MDDVKLFFNDCTYQKAMILIDDIFFEEFDIYSLGILPLKDVKLLPYDFFVTYKEKVKYLENHANTMEEFILLSHHYHDIHELLCFYNQAWEIDKILKFEKNNENSFFIYVLTKSKEMFRLKFKIDKDEITPELFIDSPNSYKDRLLFLHHNALKHPSVRLRLTFFK